jgi:hypothetical protein
MTHMLVYRALSALTLTGTLVFTLEVLDQCFYELQDPPLGILALVLGMGALLSGVLYAMG